MSRCMCFTDQPERMNSCASQSSSSGCEGFVPLRPKSLGVSTRPVPKCPCQMRFTITRAVSGFCGLAIQSASARRRSLLGGVSAAVSDSPSVTEHGGRRLLPSAARDRRDSADESRRACGRCRRKLSARSRRRSSFASSAFLSCISRCASCASVSLRPFGGEGRGLLVACGRTSGGRSNRRRPAIRRRRRRLR